MITFNKMGTMGFGRLGNQMFQYSLIFSVAKKCNFDFGVPYKNKSKNDYCNFFLDEGFKINAIDSSNYVAKQKFSEKIFGFDDSVFKVKDSTDFSGFFQSEKYFKDFKDAIRKEFDFKDEIICKSNEVLQKFSFPLAYICARRGDYLSANFRKIHLTCNKNYFLNCSQKIPEDVVKLIISDDKDYAQKLSKSIKNSHVIEQDFSDLQNKFIILRIMSLCDYHVISNSSFCWWGAWLCDKKNKKVFAPKNWFRRERLVNSWKDIYCENWDIVENSQSIFL